MTPAEVLREAADLLEPKGAWCQGELALDAFDHIVHPGDPQACSHCVIGAIRFVKIESMEAELWIERFLGVRTATWNDKPGRTQAEVVATLRAAAGEWERKRGGGA